MGDAPLKSFILYLPVHLTNFSPCGTNALLDFASNVASRGASDRFGPIKTR